MVLFSCDVRNRKEGIREDEFAVISKYVKNIPKRGDLRANYKLMMQSNETNQRDTIDWMKRFITKDIVQILFYSFIRVLDFRVE